MSATIKEGSDRTICNQDKQQPIMAYDEINDQIALVELDPASGAITMIDELHHKCHVGMHFNYQGATDLALNSVLDFQWTIADNVGYEPHFTWELLCEANTQWYIYRGVTINVAGTAITPRNNNENSTNTSKHTLASITNTSLANADADTAVAGATEVANGFVPAGNRGALNHISGEEIILKTNTIYCLRAVAVSAGWVSVKMEWYEHYPHRIMYYI